MLSQRHKKIEIFNGAIEVGTWLNGIYFISQIVDHTGKTNHKISCNFAVTQRRPNMIDDIRLYLMNEWHVFNWFWECIKTSNQVIIPPKQFLFGTNGQVTHGNFEKEIHQSIHAFFVLDNSYSRRTIKQVSVVINEEWDEIISSLDVVTTIPPQDKSLNSDLQRIIQKSKSSLKIVSPYIDMSLIGDLLTQHQRGVDIKIITRTKDEVTGKDKKDTFDYLQKNLKLNHKTNKNIHSRIIIRDEEEALVSSADLTYDSLIAQFNVGIVTSNSDVIKKLLEYFCIVWQKS